MNLLFFASTLLILASASVCRGAAEQNGVAQSSTGDCSPNTYVNGDGNTITIICRGKQELARIAMLQPLLVDFRPILDPGMSTIERLRNGPVAVTVQSLDYVNQSQGGLNAHVQKQEATIIFDGSVVPFRWFNFVGLQRRKPNEMTGWHGRIGEAQPFTLEAGKSFSTTTMFRPQASFTWSEAMSRIRTSKMLTVTVTTWISGVDPNPNVTVEFEIVCNADLDRARKAVDAFEARTGREASYVHIYCNKPLT